MRTLFDSTRILFLLVLLLTFPTVAYAAEQTIYTNDDCIACHAPSVKGHGEARVDYSVDLVVDYTRCGNCHTWSTWWFYASLGCPDASAGDTIHACGESGCHNGMAGPYYVPDAYVAGYGYFATPGSPSSTPQVIHAAHVGREMRFTPANGIDTFRCQTCHYSLNCTECHRGKLPAHRLHGIDPDTGIDPYGTVSEVVCLPRVGYTTVELRCITSACHNPQNKGSVAWKPECTTCHPLAAQRHGANAGPSKK